MLYKDHITCVRCARLDCGNSLAMHVTTGHFSMDTRESFRNFFLDKATSDITVQVYGMCIPAHSFVLAATAPSFKAMLANGAPHDKTLDCTPPKRARDWTMV